MIRQPDLSLEKELWQTGHRRIAGCDGVGLGCICGPVVAAAVIVPPDCRMIEGVRDSKMLSAGQRESLVDEIKAQAVSFGVGAASAIEVERLNVRVAEIVAVRRALRRVAPWDHALMDGKDHRLMDFHPYKTVVDGDASSYSIACASIVAKVMRDRLMAKLAGRYPGYGWEHNVGYSTPEHRAALDVLGLTPHHRRTFVAIKMRLDGMLSPEPLDDLETIDRAGEPVPA